MRKVAVAGVAGVAVAAAAAAVTGAVTLARVLGAAGSQRRGELPEAGSADALVVFGCHARADGPGAELRARLDHAALLWQSDVAPVVLVSGGIDGDVDEVAVMRDYLVAAGLPEASVVPARPGYNTRATWYAVQAWDPDLRYVAVSSPTHAHRLAVEGRRRGLRVALSCAPTTPEDRRPEMLRARVATEAVACLVYALPETVGLRVRRVLGRRRHTIPHVLAGRWRPGRGLRPYSTPAPPP